MWDTVTVLYQLHVHDEPIGERGIGEDEWSITRKQFDSDRNLLAVDVNVDQEAA
jgi:hypothetical protein